MKHSRPSLTDALRHLALDPNNPMNLLRASAAAIDHGMTYAFAPIIEAASYAWPNEYSLAFHHANTLAMNKAPKKAANVLQSIVDKFKSGKCQLEPALPWFLIDIAALASKIERADIADDLVNFILNGSPLRITMALRLAVARALVLTWNSTEGIRILRESLDYVRRLHLEPGTVISADDAALGRMLRLFNLPALVSMLASHLTMQQRYTESTQFMDKMARNLPLLSEKSLPILKRDCERIRGVSSMIRDAAVEFSRLRRRPQALITLPIWGAKYFDFFRRNVSTFWQQAVSRFPGIIAIQVVTQHKDAGRARALLADFAGIDNVEMMCTVQDESIRAVDDVYAVMTTFHNVGFCLAKENGLSFFPMISDAVINADFFAKADHILGSGYDAIMMVGMFWRADKLEQLKDQMLKCASIGSFDIAAHDMHASIADRTFAYATTIANSPDDRSLLPANPSLFFVQLPDRAMLFGTQRHPMGLSSNALSKLHFLPRGTYDNHLIDRLLLAIGPERIWMNDDCKDLVWFALEENDRQSSASQNWRQAGPSQWVGDFESATLRSFNLFRNLTSPGRMLSLRHPLVVHFSREQSDDRDENRYRRRFERIADLLEASCASRADLLLRDDLIGDLAIGLFPREGRRSLSEPRPT